MATNHAGDTYHQPHVNQSITHRQTDRQRVPTTKQSFPCLVCQPLSQLVISLADDEGRCDISQSSEAAAQVSESTMCVCVYVCVYVCM